MIDEELDLNEMDDEDMGVDIITLTDEEGTEYSFEVLDTLEIDEERYIALLPMIEEASEAVDDAGDLVILKCMEDEDGEEVLVAIEDEDEFDNVSAIFTERLSEAFEIID